MKRWMGVVIVAASLLAAPAAGATGHAGGGVLLGPPPSPELQPNGPSRAARVPAGTPGAGKARYPTFVWETPKYDLTSLAGRAAYLVGSIALSLVTVPAKFLTTLALTPAFLFFKARDAANGRDDAQAFAERNIAGDYAVLPTHLSGDRPWRFFGAP